MKGRPERIRLWKRTAAGLLLAVLILLLAFIGVSNLACHELGSDTGHAPVVVLHGGPGHSSQSLRGPDFKEDLRRLPVRTLVIYGAADAAYTGQANAAGLCELLPDCELVGFERSGHWPFLEEPERFALEVRAFLAER
jgi:proline iminopeptidase